jgi:pimeloyl-ACP methyl ester carboxylesterase
VLWVHGYTLNATIWPPVWNFFPGWRHIGFDLPWHGRSRPIRPGETLPRLAETITGLARRYQARHLIGLSFGGMVALQMAIDDPAAFDTLTLSSPAVGGGPGDPASRARHGELARLYRDRGPGQWMTELWMSSPPDIFRGAAQHPQLWRILRRAVDRHSWAELSDTRLRDLLSQPQQMQAVDAITADTLVLVGEHDIGSFRRAAELLRFRIPECTVVHCPDAGHLSLLENPSAIAPRIWAHLEGGIRA